MAAPGVQSPPEGDAWDTLSEEDRADLRNRLRIGAVQVSLLPSHLQDAAVALLRRRGALPPGDPAPHGHRGVCGCGPADKGAIVWVQVRGEPGNVWCPWCSQPDSVWLTYCKTL